MMTFTKSLITLFALCYTSLSGVSQSSISIDKINTIDSLCMEQMKSANFPGMAVMLSLHGETIFSKGYGFADLDQKTVVNPEESLFRIGSISKSLTAAALAILVEKNKINLDDPIQNYVPYFPEKNHKITLRNLACHTAGIRHYKGIEFIFNKEFSDVKSGIELFKDDALEFQPGTQYKYSTYGWNLISAGIEGGSNTDFLNYMQNNVFSVLGMNKTYAEKEQFLDKNMVAFYNHNDQGQLYYAMPVNNSYKWAGGGFLSTASDLIKFGNGINNDKLFNSETKDTFWTSCKLDDGSITNYGLGWVVNSDDAGRNFVGHSGGSIGGISNLLIYPEDELVVVVLVNLSQAKMNNLAGRIANVALD